MPEYRKMAAFIPAGGDSSLSAEFGCWHPSPEFSLKEKRAMQSWNGGTLDFIKAEVGLPFIDLPTQLQHMIKYCWQAASPTAGAARGRVQLAGGRQAQLDSLSKSRNPADIFKAARAKLAGAPAARQVHPLAANVLGTPDQVGHLDGIARDWKLMDKVERVNAYTFRGDSRPPAEIAKANGFHPPITRTDTWYVDNVVFKQFKSYMERRHGMTLTKAMFDKAYANTGGDNEANHVLRNFIVWQSAVESEAYHLGRMLASEALKGYTSTTRATPVAKGFAKAGGWVYLCLVQGGYLVPDQGKHVWTGIFGEQEIALPGAVPWASVFAFRQVSPAKTGPTVGKFAGPIYVRKGFDARNSHAFQESYQLLSGKAQ